MLKRQLKKFLIGMLIVGLVLGISLPVQADNGASDTESINEKLGSPIVVYGAQLNKNQRTEVRKLLNIKEADNVEEFDVSGQDGAKYINGDPNSNMYSSAKITRQEEGNGLTINIVTPDNITEVTKEMYANALLTAGVENATVDVASPVKVSGHSALTGIYKAYDVKGEQLDKERMELANDELDVATDLAKKEGMSQEKVSELLTEIKQTIAEQNPATKEDVERIVQEQLDKLEISLSEADKQMLIDLFEKMRDLNIDFDKVKNQLEDIASTIKDKANELGLDEGFWEKVANFFSELFQALSNFFKGLFN
ncbi:MAG: DUF1002 domain-containing protein [Bacillota bacterium]|uniref:DUF1002 domain-containing protein n=1 Tax=Virgibacillus salarius TaxID=447199 RepID=A0A941IAH6_9BACI|nr:MULTISPECIES: DUF1002 domain-containing protein [Bacillaceae]NAZ09408.1 DUF1002 domain-containing protein [Agaribacter marinus]MBR7796698.1 DUF1002 domain-containing protein [Virgibacillus salarius]MCC2252601.1 DUF1002 domain-containing protein [Virgibacillus sp. AGTR]MDY7046565.1 DUF1002 domain-containing protein [Virgibacillus sp. M23]QRZ18626.1 DUF1002 domain-containing protein [Virgibacillus sp. AGTR]